MSGLGEWMEYYIEAINWGWGDARAKEYADSETARDVVETTGQRQGVDQ